MLHAVISFERSYITLDQLGTYFTGWVKGAGVFAMIILGIWGLWFVLKAALRDGKWNPQGISGQLGSGGAEDAWKVRAFQLLLVLSIAGIAAVLSMILAKLFSAGSGDVSTLFEDDPREGPTKGAGFFRALFFITCVVSLLTVSWEMLVDLFRLSFRRLFAIAKFAIKEAIRRKILWSFLLLGMVFLFGSWFIAPDKRENQWAQYVNLVFLVMSVMILVTSAVLACFSLPADIKSQTIYTVVTKPVRRLEIMLGRILGIVFLMTLVLAVAGALSLLYVFGGLDEDIKKNSLRSRVVLYGKELAFPTYNEQGQLAMKDKGVNVGREWEYFQYIRGGTSAEAIWIYTDLPADFKNRNRIPVEFSFDIYRTTKGGIDTFAQGVDVQVTFVNTSKWNPNRYNEYRDAKNSAGLPLTAEEKAKEFGYYELSRPVKAFDEGLTTRVDFPGSIMDADPNGVLHVKVNCRSNAQYLGTARKNLYIIAREANWVSNFFKGVTSIWFYMVLIVVVGVVFSTYFNAPISLLLSIILIIMGQPKIRDFIESQSKPDDPQNDPGGKMLEAFYRLVNQENMVSQLADSAAVRFVKNADETFRYLFVGVHKVIPDLSQYDRVINVSEGFDIPGSEIAASFVVLLLYLIPFLILGYYFLTGREVAA